DRVLDRDDVLRLGLVDLVDDRRERGGLARTGRAGEQDDPALLVGDLRDDGGKPELLDRADLVRDRATDDRDDAALPERVHAEAGKAGDAEREVDLVLLVEFLQLRRVVGEQLLDEALGVLGGQSRSAWNRLELPEAADQRRRGDLEVEVRALELDYASESRLEFEHEPCIGRLQWGLKGS